MVRVEETGSAKRPQVSFCRGYLVLDDRSDILNKNKKEKEGL